MGCKGVELKMKVVAINTSPRKNWNTDLLVKKAAKGAESKGAEVVFFDLYSQERFTGCISCFGCKRNEGHCVYRDGIQPILQAIDEADALIIGTPNYLGQPSAGFHALYERLVFQNITYQKERRRYREADKPVLFIMTSNAPKEAYDREPYLTTIRTCQNGLSNAVGPCDVYICGNTLQVNDYSIYNWTLFDPEDKKERREKVFPQEKAEVFELGQKLTER